MLRQGIRSWLETRPSCHVVGEAANGWEAVEKAVQLRPDLVLLDITMPELDGIEATRQILKAVAGTQVLILTMDESEKTTREVLRAGACGCVVKSDLPAQLLPAIERALKSKHPATR